MVLMLLLQPVVYLVTNRTSHRFSWAGPVAWRGMLGGNVSVLVLIRKALNLTQYSP